MFFVCLFERNKIFGRTSSSQEFKHIDTKIEAKSGRQSDKIFSLRSNEIKTKNSIKPQKINAKIQEATSGSCGASANWQYNSQTRVLSITGNGEMTDFNSPTQSDNNPWKNYKSSIETVSIGSSITSIGSNAFYGCSSLKTIEIPSSVTSIGSNAFRGCSSLDCVEAGSSECTQLNNYLYRFLTGRNLTNTGAVKEDKELSGTAVAAISAGSTVAGGGIIVLIILLIKNVISKSVSVAGDVINDELDEEEEEAKENQATKEEKSNKSEAKKDKEEKSNKSENINDQVEPNEKEASAEKEDPEKVD